MTAPRAYLDYNATAPLRPEAKAAMIAALDAVGNPSSVHREGRAARALVEDARERVANCFGVRPENVIFTSGGTEAANALLQATRGARLLVSPTEHPCVLHGHRFESDAVRPLKVADNGLVDLEDLKEAVAADIGAGVIAVQAANNETGVVQPVRDIAALGQENGLSFVYDAVQAVGRLPMESLAGAGAVFVSAHKFGGPKGAGAIVFQRDSDAGPVPLIRGGGQERGHRSGTENVAGVAGLAAALDAALADREAIAVRTKKFQAEIESGIRAISPDAVVFGENAPRLPNTTCFAVPGLSAEMALIAFDLDGVSVSSGSACSSGKVSRSHVLDAMGVPKELSEGAIRVSTGWATTEADIERFLTAFEKICSRQRVARAA